MSRTHAVTRRRFVRTASAAGAALTLPLGLGSCARPVRARPNVLVLFTDDQRFDTIAALGNDAISTPNMDRLAARGLAFTRAHIMGGTSGAVCMPSRAMLLTGRGLFHLQDRGAVIPAEHTMLPETFRSAGYRTCGIGKWHNGKAAYARCFTHGGRVFFGGMSDHEAVPVFDFDPSGEYPEEKKYVADGFSSEIFADDAVAFLEGPGREAPFLLYVAFTAPHDPRTAPAEFARLYDPDRIELPANFLPEHPFPNGEMHVRDENLAPHPRPPEDIREHIADYYAMITHLDSQIGRILDALEATGRAGDTFVVFAGDNGLALGRHGLMGKQNLYEHSVRVPLLLSGPDVPVGERTDTLCYLNDLYRTICDLAGLRAPASVEGVSLAPVVRRPGRRVRDSLLLAYRGLQRGVRTADDWKMIRYMVGGQETVQLFDLSTDPGETVNLAGLARYSGQEEALTDLLRRHMLAADDFCDLDEPNWGKPREINASVPVEHLAVGATITNLSGVRVQYATHGLTILTDGMRATSDFRDGGWAAVQGEDLEVQLDLGREVSVSQITVPCLEQQESWIFLPRAVEVSFSTDGRAFGERHRTESPPLEPYGFTRIAPVVLETDGILARWLRVRIESIGQCPAWHAGAGDGAWIFADEIIVE